MWVSADEWQTKGKQPSSSNNMDKTLISKVCVLKIRSTALGKDVQEWVSVQTLRDVVVQTP